MNEFRKECEKIAGKYADRLEKPPKDISGLALPCFSFSKEPQVLAKELAGNFSKKLHQKGKDSLIRKIEAVGPYVNFYINFSSLAPLVLKEKIKPMRKKKENVMVEFFHANTHKAVHIGHIRNICLGSSLSNILEFNGFHVIRANYQGDIGPHVAKALYGYIHTKQKKKGGRWISELYSRANKLAKQDEAVAKEIEEINKKLYAGDEKLMKVWKETRQLCLNDFEKIYKDFNVRFDRLYFESEVEKRGVQLARELEKKKIAKKSEGAVIVDLSKYNLGIYVALTKQNHAVYHSKDYALAEIKQKEYKIDKSIHVVGKEQELYFKQLVKTFELMKDPIAGKTFHLIYGLVMLPEGKMSSREGNVVMYSDLMEKMLSKAGGETKKRHKWNDKKIKETAKKIALGAIKFDMIKKENNSIIIFDWDKAMDFEGDTGPYIMYTYARIRSILKKSKKKGKIGFLGEAEEPLIKKLAEFYEVVADAAADYKPNKLANYLLQLAAITNEYYHKTKIISSSLERERLALIEKIADVLEKGLSILGIDTLEEM